MAKMVQNEKVDLTAIFRLEFYRKQQHWKFCPDRHLKKSRKAKILNKTYIVERPISQSVLNEAFLDTGPESPPESPQVTKIQEEYWSLKPETEPEHWSEHEKVTANCHTLKEIPEQSEIWHLPNKVPEKSENTDKWIRRMLYWGRTDGQTELESDEYVEPGMIKKNNNDIEPDWSAWMNIEHGYAFIQDWPNNQDWPQNLWSDYCHCQKVVEGGGEDRMWPKEPPDFTDEGLIRMYTDDELLLSLPDPPLVDPEPCPNYLELSVQWPEFTCGASRAPHSSEADLSLPLSSVADMELDHLENLELSEAAGEARTIPEITHLTTGLPLTFVESSSYEEYPTRDVGFNSITAGAMPTRPTTGTNIPTLGNFKGSSNNIDIPKNGKPTSGMSYFEGTYYSEKSYIPSSNFASTSEYDIPTCGISTKDVILAGSFKNNMTFDLNFETIQNTKFEGIKHVDGSNNCFGPIVGRGRGRLSNQDTYKSNNMRYYK